MRLGRGAFEGPYDFRSRMGDGKGTIDRAAGSWRSRRFTEISTVSAPRSNLREQSPPEIGIR